MNENVETILQDVKVVRKNGSPVTIKNVPANQLDGELAFSFRVGLEMDYYKRNDKGDKTEVEYASIAHQLKNTSNMAIINR